MCAWRNGAASNAERESAFRKRGATRWSALVGSLAGQLGRQHVDTLNGRRLGEQFTRLCHQRRRRNLAGQIGLAACIIRKCIKDSEG
jgi:hypothetical protein